MRQEGQEAGVSVHGVGGEAGVQGERTGEAGEAEGSDQDGGGGDEGTTGARRGCGWEVQLGSWPEVVHAEGRRGIV